MKQSIQRQNPSTFLTGCRGSVVSGHAMQGKETFQTQRLSSV